MTDPVTPGIFLLLKFSTSAGESQKLHDNPDGSVLFEADVACKKDFKDWVMPWGAGTIVLEPEELRNEICVENWEMLAFYAEGAERVEVVLPDSSLFDQ